MTKYTDLEFEWDHAYTPDRPERIAEHHAAVAAAAEADDAVAALLALGASGPSGPSGGVEATASSAGGSAGGGSGGGAAVSGDPATPDPMRFRHLYPEAVAADPAQAPPYDGDAAATAYRAAGADYRDVTGAGAGAGAGASGRGADYREVDGAGAGAGDADGERGWDPHAAGATPPPRRSQIAHQATKRNVASKETDIDAAMMKAKGNLEVTDPDGELPALVLSPLPHPPDGAGTSQGSPPPSPTPSQSSTRGLLRRTSTAGTPQDDSSHIEIDVGNGDLPAPAEDKTQSGKAQKPQRIRLNKDGTVRERERLTFCSIVFNVIYNAMLMVAMILSLGSYYMYEWIESDADEMEKNDIYVVEGAPGFNKVSCGLTTYCIDAAGSVSECTLPWPRYGNDDVIAQPDQLVYSPVLYWRIAAGLVLGATFCLFLAWAYTFFACFGCFRSRVQRWCNNLVVLAGTLLVSAVLLFAASFEDLAVRKCMLPNANATADSDPPCTAWLAELPSEMIEGKGNAGCRICPQAVGAFTISTSCQFGWGAKVAVAACLIAYFSTYFGQRVTSRRRKKRQFSLRSFASRRLSSRKSRTKSRIAEPMESTESAC